MKTRSTLAAGLLTSLLSVAPMADDIVFHKAPGALANYPFSESVEAGGFLFLSGQLGTDASGKLAMGGIEAETHQTMQNIRQALARRGLTLKDVVKCTVFLADIAEWPAFNTVYKGYFDGVYPARSALAASGLALNARVEVECLAKMRDE